MLQIGGAAKTSWGRKEPRDRVQAQIILGESQRSRCKPDYRPRETPRKPRDPRESSVLEKLSAEPSSRWVAGWPRSPDFSPEPTQSDAQQQMAQLPQGSPTGYMRQDVRK